MPRAKHASERSSNGLALIVPDPGKPLPNYHSFFRNSPLYSPQLVSNLSAGGKMRAARASRSSYSEPDAFVIIDSKILSKTCLIIVINKRSKDTVIKKEGKNSITKGLPERV